jgi:hypothetical protein
MRARGDITEARSPIGYSHVTPGLQEAAAEKFDRLLNPEPENEHVLSHY